MNFPNQLKFPIQQNQIPNQLLLNNINLNMNVNMNMNNNYNLHQMQLLQMQLLDSQKQKMIYPKDLILVDKENIKEFELNKEEELRIEVCQNTTIKITLLKGYAEIEGLALPLGQGVYITNRKFPVFCWEASKIEIIGKPDICYIGKDTPMISYLMSFYLIHNRRLKALDTNQIGPRVLILGSKNSGKRTLTHIFLNYSLKLGYKPIYVDLSLNNEISLPGSISATVFDEPYPNDYLIENSIIFFNGNLNISSSSSNIKSNTDLFNLQIEELGKIVSDKLEYDLESFKSLFISNENQVFSSAEPELYAAGSIIYCDTFDGFQIETYKNIVSQFKVDLIFIIDNDRLYSALSSSLSLEIGSKTMEIVKLNKSPGVVNNNDVNIKNNQRLSLYYRGSLNNVSMKGFEIPLTQVKILQIINSQIDVNLVTIGKRIDLKLIIKQITSFEENISVLLKRIVSINHLSKGTIEGILNSTEYDSFIQELSCSTVEYFGYIAKIDNMKITIQTPAQELKHMIFLIGEIKYA